MSAAAIYLRSGEIVVIPQGGGGGYFVDVEPILVVPPDPEAVQTAVEEALRASAANDGIGPPPKGWKSPVLKHFGVRSYKAFTANAKLCYVFEDAGSLEVEPWRPASDGRGFEQAPEGAKPISDPSEIGAAVLKAVGVNE